MIHMLGRTEESTGQADSGEGDGWDRGTMKIFLWELNNNSAHSHSLKSLKQKLPAERAPCWTKMTRPWDPYDVGQQLGTPWEERRSESWKLSVAGLSVLSWAGSWAVPESFIHIHSPTEGHVGSFRVLAIMNKAAANIGVQVFVYK